MNPEQFSFKTLSLFSHHFTKTEQVYLSEFNKSNRYSQDHSHIRKHRIIIVLLNLRVFTITDNFLKDEKYSTANC
jgi:hypothetical protein